MRESRTEFAIRYYQWSLAWSIAEAEADFERVAAVKSAICQPTLAFFESLQLSDRRALAVGLVNRFHPVAVRALGIVTSAHEAELVAAKDAAVNKAAPLMLRERLQKMDVSRLRRAVEAAIGASAGQEVDGHPGGFRYQVTSGPWQLTTQVALASELVYVQNIRAGASVSLAEGISILSWCGFSSQTVWDRCERGNETEVAETLRNASAEFVRSWSELVDGLYP